MVCRVSPSRFLAECRKRRLNHGSYALFAFCQDQNQNSVTRRRPGLCISRPRLAKTKVILLIFIFFMFILARNAIIAIWYDSYDTNAVNHKYIHTITCTDRILSHDYTDIIMSLACGVIMSSLYFVIFRLPLSPLSSVSANFSKFSCILQASGHTAAGRTSWLCEASILALHQSADA